MAPVNTTVDEEGHFTCTEPTLCTLFYTEIQTSDSI